MKNLLTSIVLIIALFSTAAMAETVVIVHPANPVKALRREQVLDIYLGKTQNFPDAGIAFPIDLPPDSQVRSDFYRKLVDKSVAQINAYWARLLFTGRATPPKMLKSNKNVLKSVSENRDAIAYIDSGDLDSKVKVVFRFK